MARMETLSTFPLTAVGPNMVIQLGTTNMRFDHVSVPRYNGPQAVSNARI